MTATPTSTRAGAAPRDRIAFASSESVLLTLRRRWYLVLLAGALAAGAALAVSVLLLPTVYRSSATIIVSNPPATDEVVRSGPFVDDQSLSETFAQLALQPAVAEAVARELGLRTSQLEGRVSVRAIPRTPLVVISYDGATPDEAAQGSQIYTAQFVQSSRRTTFLPGRVLIVSGATLPTEPIAPRPLLNTLVAGIAGLLLGVGLLVARASLAAAQGARPAPPTRERRPSRALDRFPARDRSTKDLDPSGGESVNGRRGAV